MQIKLKTNTRRTTHASHISNLPTASHQTPRIYAPTHPPTHPHQPTPPIQPHPPTSPHPICFCISFCESIVSQALCALVGVASEIPELPANFRPWQREPLMGTVPSASQQEIRSLFQVIQVLKFLSGVRSCQKLSFSNLFLICGLSERRSPKFR